MADNLIDRLDRFAIGLLDEAEGDGCDAAPSDDTSKISEDSPGPVKARASLSERIAALKAVTSYLAFREKQSGGDGKPDEAEGEPEIVRFERRLNHRKGRR